MTKLAVTGRSVKTDEHEPNVGNELATNLHSECVSKGLKCQREQEIRRIRRRNQDKMKKFQDRNRNLKKKMIELRDEKKGCWEHTHPENIRCIKILKY